MKTIQLLEGRETLNGKGKLDIALKALFGKDLDILAYYDSLLLNPEGRYTNHGDKDVFEINSKHLSTKVTVFDIKDLNEEDIKVYTISIQTTANYKTKEGEILKSETPTLIIEEIDEYYNILDYSMIATCDFEAGRAHQEFMHVIASQLEKLQLTEGETYVDLKVFTKKDGQIYPIAELEEKFSSNTIIEDLMCITNLK